MPTYRPLLDLKTRPRQPTPQIVRIETLSTVDDGLLRGVRGTLADADEALLCVAFVSRGGVQLLHDPLEKLGARARLLVTTAFGSSAAEALNHAHDLGVRVGVLNPAGATTYHPKLYLARHGGAVSAVVGSANLTQGLVGNVEFALQLAGPGTARPLRDAWTWAEARWDDDRVRPWEVLPLPEDSHETFARDLYALLRGRFASNAVHDRVVQTLGAAPRPNRISNLTPYGLHVETERSRAQGTGPQLVPAWMFNLAWTYLQAHGRLTNRHLLDMLHVHRSAAVCAILAELPPVAVASRRPITLAWRGPRTGRDDAALPLAPPDGS